MISVILPTYNRSDTLRRTLHSLQSVVVPPALEWELIVVDNNSNDATHECVSELQRTGSLPIRYLFERHQGANFARNAGIKAARGEILLFTDDDVTFDRNWLAEMSDACAEPGCIGVGGKIVAVWFPDQPKWAQTNGQYSVMSVIPSFDLGDERCTIATSPFTANWALKRTAFEKYGLFRTDLGPRSGDKRVGGGGDDTEFGRRLLAGGETLIYAPSAIVYHPVESERTNKQYFQLWYFDYGKSLIRTSTEPYPVACLGVPGFLLRRLGESMTSWFCSFDSQKRFYYKLHTYLYAGEIVEAFRRRSAGGHPSNEVL
jgi:glycosyltransferase involved in cell wall biosynthesis